MATITCSNKQLKLIQIALDFYSRVGIGQFGEIKDHDTFQVNLENVCRPDKTPEVGDRTNQGKIIEIKGKKALIDGSIKNGMWNKSPEWVKLSEVKLSTDYDKYHEIRDRVDNLLTEARNILTQDFSTGKNGSWGIYNTNVDNTCREAFNMVQCVRHEFWKINPNKNFSTVDSSVDSWMQSRITVKLD